VSDIWSCLTRLASKLSLSAAASSTTRASYFDIQGFSILIDCLVKDLTEAVRGHLGCLKAVTVVVYQRVIARHPVNKRWLSVWVSMQATCPKSVRRRWRMVSDRGTCDMHSPKVMLELQPCHQISRIRQRRHWSLANEWSAATAYIATSIQRHEWGVLALHLHIKTDRVTHEDMQNACTTQMECCVCGASSDARKSKI